MYIQLRTITKKIKEENQRRLIIENLLNLFDIFFFNLVHTFYKVVDVTQDPIYFNYHRNLSLNTPLDEKKHL